MLHTPLIKCEVHQAAFVHNKIHLGTSVLIQHYPLVIWGVWFQVFQYRPPLYIFIYLFFHFNFFTKTAIPDMWKILSFNTLEVAGPQKGNLDTEQGRDRSRNPFWGQGVLPRFGDSVVHEQSCVCSLLSLWRAALSAWKGLWGGCVILIKLRKCVFLPAIWWWEIAGMLCLLTDPPSNSWWRTWIGFSLSQLTR